MSEKTNFSEWLKSIDRRQKKDAESAKEKGETSAASAGESPIWLHCSVGAEMSAGEEEEDGNQACSYNSLWSNLGLTSLQKGQIKPLRGFDRLAAAGFSEEDIAQFRRTFHSQHDSDLADPEDDGGDENCERPSPLLMWYNSVSNVYQMKNTPATLKSNGLTRSMMRTIVHSRKHLRQQRCYRASWLDSSSLCYHSSFCGIPDQLCSGRMVHHLSGNQM